jgi:hypothetical protein
MPDIEINAFRKQWEDLYAPVYSSCKNTKTCVKNKSGRPTFADRPEHLRLHSSLFSPHSSLISPHSSLFTLHSSLLTLHSSFFTLLSSLSKPALYPSHYASSDGAEPSHF